MNLKRQRPSVEDWGLGNQHGILLVDGVSCLDLVREFGTPLHVVHEKRLRSNIKRFKDAFSGYQPGVQVYYSYKSNGIPGVLQIIHQGEAEEKSAGCEKKSAGCEVRGAEEQDALRTTHNALSTEGLGAEVISPYELWLALRMGITPWRIVYNGISKSLESLRLALKLKVRINADSFEEVKQIEAEAKRLGRTCEIGIRVCPRAGWNSHFGLSLGDAGSGFHPLKYGGRCSVRGNMGIKKGTGKEGMPSRISHFKSIPAFPANRRQGSPADQAIEYISRSSHLVCTGLMCHLTTRATDGETHARACLDLLQFASRIYRSHGIKIQSLDLGGGFGVPTVKGFSHWESLQYRLWNRPPRAPRAAECQPIEDVASHILTALTEGCERFGLDPPVLCLEPGRIITSDAQVLLLTIGGIKQRRGSLWQGRRQVFAITDGGRFNINYPLEHEYHTAFVANKLNDPPRQKYFVVGRLCSPGDWVYRNIHLPYLRAGDVLAIMDSGAYFTQFSTNFSYPRAAVVAVRDGQARILRHRETHECMISMDRM